MRFYSKTLYRGMRVISLQYHVHILLQDEQLNVLQGPPSGMWLAYNPGGHRKLKRGNTGVSMSHNQVKRKKSRRKSS